MAAWRTEMAPDIGKSYWHLGENGTVLDLMYAIRADEAEHRDGTSSTMFLFACSFVFMLIFFFDWITHALPVNHFASDAKRGDLAPVCNPKDQVDLALKKYVKDVMTV